MLDIGDNRYVCTNSNANSRIFRNLEAQKAVPYLFISYLFDMSLFNNALSSSNGRMSDE